MISLMYHSYVTPRVSTAVCLAVLLLLSGSFQVVSYAHEDEVLAPAKMMTMNMGSVPRINRTKSYSPPPSLMGEQHGKVHTLNVPPLGYELDGDIKVFTIIAQPVEHVFTDESSPVDPEIIPMMKQIAGPTASRMEYAKTTGGMDHHEAGDMKHEMADMKHETGGMKHEMGDMDHHETGGMKHEMADMKHEMADMKHEMADMKHETGGMKHEMADMKHEMGDMKHETGGMKHEMADMKHETGGMKHEMGDMKHETGGMKHEMADMKHETGGMKHEMADMKHEMGGMKHETGGMKHEMGGMEHEMGDMDHEMGGMDHEMQGIAQSGVVWGYNGSMPGPTIEAFEGDTIRVIFKNELPEPSSIHWHGLEVPNGQDGAAGHTETPTPPGGTHVYEFTLYQTGTFMYHTGYNVMKQEALGLGGIVVIHPRFRKNPVDKDVAILLQEWTFEPGNPNPNVVSMDFNWFTFNGKAAPHIEVINVQQGDRVRLRFANLSMQSHPIHIHGYTWKVVGTEGGPIPEAGQWPGATINIPPGTTRDVEFVAWNPGVWRLHCHKLHHVMNAMADDPMEIMPHGGMFTLVRVVPKDSDAVWQHPMQVRERP